MLNLSGCTAQSCAEYSVKNVLVRLDGATVPFDNAGSVYAAQPPFYEATLPDTKPLSRQELSNYKEVWLEPISHDAELREQLRGWYRIRECWAENDFGIRFQIDSYGAKWLAFSKKYRSSTTYKVFKIPN